MMEDELRLHQQMEKQMLAGTQQARDQGSRKMPDVDKAADKVCPLAEGSRLVSPALLRLPLGDPTSQAIVMVQQSRRRIFSDALLPFRGIGQEGTAAPKASDTSC